MAKDQFDAYSDRYIDTVEQSISFSGLSHGFFQHSKALMIQDLLALRLSERPNPKLLDVGCGVGALHPLISPMFSSVEGVDVSIDSIARARTENPDRKYEVYDGLTLPYDDDSFDMCLSICVMHHVPPAHWDNFMAELNRVVSPGGLVCLIEHNPLNPATRLSVARCPFDADAVLLGTRNMRRRMRKAGLIDVATRNFVFFPSNKSGFRKIERRLHWLPLGAQYAAIGQVS
ncbi:MULTISPECIES: class I SAM-dependent methyltransferase [Halocynthiibacter]|uniref:Class I SAM-dependent methyltransferase n=1 Tax=Halocynthiibacter halioticoli TaxID=2986804 RepID=A0AAE3LRP3_9RHOB|nr:MULTISPECIES: class I SAM-dependent methyltransferase [Halocynthiibacter]MCV6825792.1 class I SAM-dependent methyltransferase [Halocynthiibacter halioticoli]MCW4058793.1 class I SAM-dependent methyltransferase [Halocynthiibacter sp. SDUM655004]